MNYKEKAKELVSDYFVLLHTPEFMPSVTTEKAKQCAFICVEEIISQLNKRMFSYSNEILWTQDHEYWQQVKQEIKRL